MKKRNYIILSFLAFFLMACSTSPQPIQFGSDDCDHCKMTISDERFGAELVTKKGRIYKFDDLHCILDFIADGTVPGSNIQSIWGVDFAHQGELVDLEKAWILRHEDLKSPMGSNAASFQSKEDAEKYQNEYGGEIIEWKDY